MPLESTDGTFTIGRDEFPDFARLARLGVHIQSDRVRVALPDPEYVQAALDALDEACRELGIPEASIVFVDTVEPPPAVGLRYGFKGSYTSDYPTIIWVFANWTRLDELREVVRHEAAHLAFARTHTAEESAGHSGPSEEFALAFERDPLFELIVAMRKIDEQAKVQDLPLPQWTDYKNLIMAHLTQQN